MSVAKSRVVLAAVAAVVASGCAAAGTPHPQAGALSTVAPATPGKADVAMELRAPRLARWISSTLSPATPTLGVVVKNQSATRVDVSNLRVHLEAVREGVSFRCATSVGPPDGVREPSSLAPGEVFVFERALDCALPLTGRYSVRVSVSFGRGEWSQPRPVRALTLDVAAPVESAPREIPSIPGLWAAIGASALLVDTDREGAGRIAIALVNGGPKPLALPRLRLGLRVYRAGSPIPCEDAPIDLDVPRVLAPGQSHRAPVSVSCLALDTPGNYEVVARLLYGASSEAELGKLRIAISDDPTRINPPLVR